jgi:hypothetical protein
MLPEARMLMEQNADDIAHWCGGRVVVQHDALDDSITTHAVNVPTIPGIVERAQPGDIIRLHDGCFSVHKGV